MKILNFGDYISVILRGNPGWKRRLIALLSCHIRPSNVLPNDAMGRRFHTCSYELAIITL